MPILTLSHRAHFRRRSVLSGIILAALIASPLSARSRPGDPAIAAPPGAFNRTFPTENLTLAYEGIPALTWSASSGATSYEYCIDETNDEECSNWISTGGSTTVTLNGLSAGYNYYWHVRAINGEGTTYADGSATTFWRFATSPRYRWWIDLDGEDTGDVFLYNGSSGAWWRQNSQGQGLGFNEVAGNWNPGWSPLAAEFDGNLRTDMFLFNQSSGQWFKMVNDGSGFIAQANGAWWPGWERHALDLDGDGITDFFLYDPTTGVWFRCISTPTGFTYTQGGWNPGWEIHPMNLNRDRLGDIFLINRTTGRWFWATGDTAGGFTYPVTETWYPGWDLYAGDFNGDKRDDLLLHDPPTGTYFVASAGDTGFSYVQGGWSLGWKPYVAEFNGDAQDDLLLHAATTGNWFQMFSNGAGGFTNAGGETWSLGWSLHVTDFNQNGRSDLLLYDPASGAWYQARYSTPGVFTYSSGTWGPGLTVVAGYVRR
jgi:hypothetical protein